MIYTNILYACLFLTLILLCLSFFASPLLAQHMERKMPISLRASQAIRYCEAPASPLAISAQPWVHISDTVLGTQDSLTIFLHREGCHLRVQGADGSTLFADQLARGSYVLDLHRFDQGQYQLHFVAGDLRQAYQILLKDEDR